MKTCLDIDHWLYHGREDLDHMSKRPQDEQQQIEQVAVAWLFDNPTVDTNHFVTLINIGLDIDWS